MVFDAAENSDLVCDWTYPWNREIWFAWMIPKDAVKPADARIKSGKYIGVYGRTHKKAEGMKANN